MVKKINCKLKKNRSKAICRTSKKRKIYISASEYANRELWDNYAYIPFFLILVFILSAFGIVKAEDQTTLLLYLVIGAIASTCSFLITRYWFMRDKK